MMMAACNSWAIFSSFLYNFKEHATKKNSTRRIFSLQFVLMKIFFHRNAKFLFHGWFCLTNEYIHSWCVWGVLCEGSLWKKSLFSWRKISVHSFFNNKLILFYLNCRSSKRWFFFKFIFWAIKFCLRKTKFDINIKK